jgi:hypothetical protein
MLIAIWQDITTKTHWQHTCDSITKTQAKGYACCGFGLNKFGDRFYEIKNNTIRLCHTVIRLSSPACRHTNQCLSYRDPNSADITIAMVVASTIAHKFPDPHSPAITEQAVKKICLHFYSENRPLLTGNRRTAIFTASIYKNKHLGEAQHLPRFIIKCLIWSKFVTRST